MSMSGPASVRSSEIDQLVRRTIQVAMLIFVWTISVGILNGLDLVEFQRKILLSHLHGGTLGWMTLSILAFAMWLFGGNQGEGGDDAIGWIHRVVVLAVVAIPSYVVVFATTTEIARPIAGTATWIALIGFAIWAFQRAQRTETLTVPHLLALLGLLSSVLGGTFGVLNGIAVAQHWTRYPDGLFEAHPGTMEIGFVVPVAMGVSEWILTLGRPDEKPTRLGKAQVVLMFLAFAWVLTFILADQEELVGPGTLFGIIAVGIFYKRMWSIIRATRLTARTPARHAVAGAFFIGVTFVYIFVIISKAQGDFAAIPDGQAISFIHLMAIGATTNAILAFVIHLSRRATEPGPVDDLIFWGVNIGLAGFVVALTTDTRGLIAVFTPIMGAALLTAIVTHAAALHKAPAGWESQGRPA